VKEKAPNQIQYRPNDVVVCIINSRASLTVGKEYEIIDVYGHSSTDIQEVWEKFNNEITLVVKNDQGENTWYDHMRFIPKSEFRTHIINDILKK
jgi:hypothetical protein